jgi:hypothetical protein
MRINLDDQRQRGMSSNLGDQRNLIDDYDVPVSSQVTCHSTLSRLYVMLTY